MKASVIDLRNKMSRILKAIERNENITLMYHGREKAMIIPIRNETKLKVKDHEFFGMGSDNAKNVNEIITDIRG